MSTRDLNKELLRAVQKQDLDAVKRIIKLNDELCQTKSRQPASNKNANLLGLLRLVAETKKKIKRN